ncbi:MAG: hypothetical protein ACYTG7_01380 [Planctomycetota bacterium]
MAVLVLLNNFLHDLSAAGWLFGSLLLWSIPRKGITAGDGARIIAQVFTSVQLFMRFSLAGIVIFGILRALAYKDYEWNAVAGQDQVTLLIVKHVILVFVFLWGVVQYFNASKLTGRVNLEKTE